MRDFILGKYAELPEEELQRLEQRQIEKLGKHESVKDVTPEEVIDLLNTFKEDK